MPKMIAEINEKIRQGEAVVVTAEEIIRAFRAGNKVLLFGNGGSVQRSACCHSGADNQVKPITRLSIPESKQAVR